MIGLAFLGRQWTNCQRTAPQSDRQERIFSSTLLELCYSWRHIDDGVDGTTQKPQASGKDIDLKREEKKFVQVIIQSAYQEVNQVIL